MMSLKIRKTKPGKLIFSLLLLLFALIWVLPLLFVILNMFKSRQEYNWGSFWTLPEGFKFIENFSYFINGYPIFRGLINSLFYALVGALFAVALGTLAAYGISHLKIRWKMFWFMLIYCGTIFPFQLYLIPVFKSYITIGLYDTQIGMILFYVAICIPFCMFVMRNTFLSINKEICESAKIEGATDFQILVQLFLPMTIASLSIIFLTQFTWIWNDLLFGLTLTKSEVAKTIMSMLSVMDKNNPPILFVACGLASIPTIVLFSTIQKNCEIGFVYTSK